MSKTKILSYIIGFITSLTLFSIGTLFIIHANWGLPLLRVFLVIFLVIMIISNAIATILRRKDYKTKVIYMIIQAIILVFLIQNPEGYVSFVGLVTGLYTLVTAIIYFVDFSIAREDHLSGVAAKLLLAIIFFIASLFLIFTPQRGTSLIFIVSGIYLIVGSIVRFLETIFDIFGKRLAATMSLPVIFSALIPPRVYMSIKNNPELKDKIISDPLKDDPAPVEVFIYLRDDGIFESMGHVDIAYEGTIYSYGLHDPKRRKILGSAGDGVLIKAKREPFLQNCLKSGHTIILDFKLYPSKSDMKLIADRIDDLLKDAYPFICESHAQELLGEMMVADDYISDVYRDTHCELYKFKKGRFKTYFVFTTNCVGLADHLIRNKEVDLLNMTGIITPGNYLNFLYRLYQKKDSIVKDLVILNKKAI